MFSYKIYKSWKRIQMKKFKEIVERVGKDIFKKEFILEVGSGPGYFEEFISNTKIFCLDKNLESLRKNQSKYKILGDGDKLPFKRVFDVIICFDTFHLIDGKDFVNVLKRGGLVIGSMFFNRENKMDRLREILTKLRDFKILDIFDIGGEEREVVVVTYFPLDQSQESRDRS